MNKHPKDLTDEQLSNELRASQHRRRELRRRWSEALKTADAIREELDAESAVHHQLAREQSVRKIRANQRRAS